MTTRRSFVLAGALAAVAGSSLASGDTPKLSSYFGFDPMRTVVIDPNCGPMIVADLNGDGLPDIAVVNNAKSRIELCLGRKTPKPLDEMMKDLKTNQLRPSAYYDRKDISLSARVGAMRTLDVDGDGKTDIVCAASSPQEVFVLKQQADGTFKMMNRNRVRGLVARQSLLRVADVMGDGSPEVVVLADDRITAFPLNKDGTLGDGRRLGTTGNLSSLMIEDFDGDGLMDILAIAPDDQNPVRVYAQKQDPQSKDKRGILAAEMRFESPPVRDPDVARFSGRKGASLGVIERASRRVVFYDFNNLPIDGGVATSVERESQAEVYGFADGSSKDRSVVVIDVDGDGLSDILSTDGKTNTLSLMRQRAGVGPGDAEAFSAFKQPKVIAAAAPGAWEKDEKNVTVFVLSEEEKAVGVSKYDPATRKLTFPAPVPVKTAGATPVAIGFVSLDGVGTLATVVKNKRDHTLELHQPAAAGGGDNKSEGSISTVALANVNRPPQSMLAADVDQDGKSDLLLFTPGEPMVMVRGDKGGAGKPDQVLTSETMPNFGLVQAAGPSNTAVVDFDGDGKPELLIADKNFVRACRYDAKTGWRVVSQITVADAGTDLVGLTVSDAGGAGKPATVVASDKGLGRLLFIDPSGVKQKLRLSGFNPGAIFAGAFLGDKQPGVMCVGDDAFALVRLAGNRLKMEQFAAYRSEAKDRSEHNITLGDVNGDGFLDAVVCDAREQMCSILTFTAKRNVLLATETKVYETRMFSGGDAREQEPRDVIIADATGDGKADIIFLIHDRIIVYPQMTEESAKNPARTDR